MYGVICLYERAEVERREVMSKRWAKREDAIMSDLGLRPQPLSGGGWTHKEDGESEELLAQLKSTDGKAIKVDRRDVEQLFYNALVAHKTPMFVLDFVGGPKLICMRPEDLQQVTEAMSRKTKG